MNHPFEALAPAAFRRYFRISLAAAILLFAVESWLGIPLQQCRTTAGARCGIVAFELAASPTRSAEILNAWNTQGVLHYAKWNTWLDYLFMISYANCLALAIVGVLPKNLSPTARSIGRFLAWAQWLVWACDAAENIALLRILYSVPNTPWPQMAFVCAVIKFGFVGAGIACLATVFILSLRAKSAVIAP